MSPFSRPLFDADYRAALREVLRQHGLPEPRVQEVVDLSCHAVEQALELLDAIAVRAARRDDRLTVAITALRWLSAASESLADNIENQARDVGVQIRHYGPPAEPAP